MRCIKNALTSAAALQMQLNGGAERKVSRYKMHSSAVQ